MITPDQLTPALVAWMLNPDGNRDDYFFDGFEDADLVNTEDDDGWTHVRFDATRRRGTESNVIDVKVTVDCPDDDAGDGDVVKTFRVTVVEVPS